MSDRWLVAWDFRERPKSTFYDILASEFAPPTVQYVQRSVVIAYGTETAQNLRALCRWYGANVEAFAINGHTLGDVKSERASEEYIARVHQQRLGQRGRKPKLIRRS
jgi:hypothetical protein